MPCCGSSLTGEEGADEIGGVPALALAAAAGEGGAAGARGYGSLRHGV